MTALACGMIAVGSCNGDVTSTILQTIMEKSETELKDTYARWLPLGLGLNHLGEGCLSGQRLIVPGYNGGAYVSETVLDGSRCPLDMSHLSCRQGRGHRGNPGSAGGCVRAVPQFCQHTSGCVCLCRSVSSCFPSDSSLLSWTFLQLDSPFSVVLICCRFFSFFYFWNKLFFGVLFLSFLVLTTMLQALGMY